MPSGAFCARLDSPSSRPRRGWIQARAASSGRHSARLAPTRPSAHLLTVPYLTSRLMTVFPSRFQTTRRCVSAFCALALHDQARYVMRSAIDAGERHRPDLINRDFQLQALVGDALLARARQRADDRAGRGPRIQGLMKTAVTFTVVDDALDERRRLLEDLGDPLGATPVLRIEQRLLQKETNLRRLIEPLR